MTFVTDASIYPQMFTSRPLADAQAEQGDTPKTPSASTAGAAQPDAAHDTPVRAVRLPVVDISFEDIPEQAYEDFNFPLKTKPDMIFCLGIEDDSVLFEIMEVTREESPNDIITFALTETFKRAVYLDGTEVPNGLKELRDGIDPHRRGQKESRKYLMEVVLSAVDRWSEELTDTSMRPQNRAQRRASRQRRR